MIEWTRIPPGEGYYWHTIGEAWLARPHLVIRGRDGLLYCGSTREGIQKPAEEMGGHWWPAELVRPSAAIPPDTVIQPNAD